MANMLKEVRINEKDVTLFEVIENSEADKETIPVIRKNVIKTHHYMNNMITSFSQGCEIIPRNCRFIKRNGSKIVVVVEQPPAIKSLTFDYNFNNEIADIEKTGVIDFNLTKKLIKSPNEKTVLKLAFPHIVFVMSLNEYPNNFEIASFRVFFKLHPIKRNNDYLYIANILNLSERNELCFGDGVRLLKPEMQLCDAVERLIREFWVRPFTYEYESRYKMYKKISILKNFLVWAYYTERDPMFIYGSNWILHSRNLQQEINAMELEIGGSSVTTRFNSFFVDNIKKETEGVGKFCFDTLKMTKKVLSVGDQIKIADNDLYIYNFVGDRDGPTHVILTDVKGNEIEPLKITDDLKKDWDDQLDKQLINYVNEINIGSDNIKVGDIVKIIATNTYEVVDKIRISRDNMIELECNTRFFIAREGNIQVIKSVDANGIELIPNKDYIVCNNQYQHGFVGKLIKVNSSDKNMLTIYFKDNVTNNENSVPMSSLEENDIVIFPSNDDKIKKNTEVFRYMNKLYTNTVDRYLIIKGLGVYDKRGNEYENFHHELDKSKLISNIFNDDKTELFIPGIDMDIKFKIGDKVIIGNWDQADDLMMKIRKISGFEITENNILFKLTGKSGDDDILVDYININNGTINIGYIRKVTEEFNNIPIETIVIANKIGINNFPKKNRNKIAAFIIDAQEPLVLFKNGLTMWFSDLEDNFDLLLPGTVQYKKIRKFEKLNTDNIKWQAGDLCIKEGKHYLFNNDNPYMGIVYMEIHPDFVKTGSLRSRAVVSTDLDNSFKRFGIIDPRYLKKNSVVNYELVPNFYNGAYKVPFDGYYPYTRRKLI